MILNAEASDIIAYLQTAAGKFMSLAEISRRAGGRRRFQESPNWARHLMSPLVDAGLVEVNARGHYRVPPGAKDHPAAPRPASPRPPKIQGKILGDDYFPANEGPRIVAGDYFPAND